MCGQLIAWRAQYNGRLPFEPWHYVMAVAILADAPKTVKGKKA